MALTREQIKGIFGEEVTSEQITELLNAYHSDVSAEKEKNKANSKQLEELLEQKKKLENDLKAINDKDLSDIEKLQADMKAIQDKNNEIAKENERLKLTASLAKQGIVGEDAEKLMNSLGTEDFATTLGAIISEREKSAITKSEQERMKNTAEPKGQQGKSADTEPEDVKNANSLNFGFANKNAQETRNYYK